MINAALVLEGGSLRSLYTAGVLDIFLENNIEFSCVIGVSAGSLTGANYISKQKRRSAQINILHSGNREYFGISQLLLKRSAFNFDYLFNEPINSLYPYDTKTLYSTNQRFLICATDCETAQPVYFENHSNYKKMTEYLQASSSIPLLTKPTTINDHTYIDGGIADPIGINKAVSEGYSKIVVVLTRNKEFRKTKESLLIRQMLNAKYKNNPKLLSALNNTHNKYNSLQETILEMENNKQIFVIRPQEPVNFSRIEKNPRKLIDLYFKGMQDTENRLDQMKEYLNN